nr:hypothetical protein [Tanacetum cinerariifolium]
MKEFATSNEANYYSRITSIMVNGKRAYELKGKFLDDLRDNAFSGTNREDAMEHIVYFLKIVDPINLPNVNYERLRLSVFSISLVGNASEWFDECQGLISSWVEYWWKENDHEYSSFFDWRDYIQGPYANYYKDFLDKEEHEDKERCEYFDDQERTTRFRTWTSSSTPNVSPSKRDWDNLFQPLFDEYFNPTPCFVSHMLLAAAPLPADTTATSSSTTIDQDVPYASTSPTNQEIQSQVIHQGVKCCMYVSGTSELILDIDSEGDEIGTEDEEDQSLDSDDEREIRGRGSWFSLGYKALRHCELSAGEGQVPSTFEVGQSSRSVPEHKGAGRTSAFREPTLVTWTPSSPEWSSGSFPVSPLSLAISIPVASPATSSPTASPDTVEAEDFMAELGAQRYRLRSLEREHKRATVTFSALWRPVSALEAWAGQTDAHRAALWHTMSETQRENHDLRMQLAEERRERLELADRVARMERRQESREE